jgi:hypothetical protein
VGLAALAAIVVVLRGKVDLNGSDSKKDKAAATTSTAAPKRRPPSETGKRAPLPQNPDDLAGSDPRALTHAVNLRRALVLLDRRRADREGVFDDLRLAPGRIDTQVKTPHRTLDLQMRADFSIPFADETAFPNDSDPEFRRKGLTARAVDATAPERMLRVIDRHRGGSAARDIDYFVISRDITDHRVRYGAYFKRGPRPRIVILERGRLRAIG